MLSARVLLLAAAAALVCVQLVSTVGASEVESIPPVYATYKCYGSWAGSRRVPMSNNGEGDDACWKALFPCERACGVKDADYERDANGRELQTQNELHKRYDELPCIRKCTDAWIECDNQCFARKNAAEGEKRAAEAVRLAAAEKVRQEENARRLAAEAAKKAEAEKANLARIAAQNAQWEKDEAERKRRIREEEAKRAPVVPVKPWTPTPAPTPAPAPKPVVKPAQPKTPYNYGAGGNGAYGTPKVNYGGALQPAAPVVKPAPSPKKSPATKLKTQITQNNQVNTNVKVNTKVNTNINSGNTVNSGNTINSNNRVNINSGNTVTNNNNNGQFAGNSGSVNIGTINNAGQVNVGDINITGADGPVTINVRLIDSDDLDETKPKSKTTRRHVCVQKNIQKYPELQLPCLCTAAQKKTFPQILDDCAAYDKQVAARKAAEKKARAAAKF